MAKGKRSSTIHFADRKPQGRPLDFPFISSLLERRSREQSGLFWGEGARNFHAALEAQRSIQSIVLCRQMLQGRENWRALLHELRRGTPVVEVTREEFLSVSTHAEPHGIGVVVEQRWEPLIELDPGPTDIWVVMDNVRTPGNLGTTLRTCSAVGAQGIMLIGGEADPHDPACIRASMGSIFHQRLIRTSAKAMESWKKRHTCRVIGTSPSAARHYRCIDYRGPLLLLVGNERTGLRERQRSLCDELVRLPMAGSIDSLNLAVATGVILYEAIEQRARQPAAR
jgi:TrmH family RNA methyltransferase